VLNPLKQDDIMTQISVVIPLYKCRESIVTLTDLLIKSLSDISEDFEIIYVNDASPQNDWEIVTTLSLNDKRIKGLNFSRNFGQHYAITAGLDYAQGEWVIVMDGDLQDQPEEIIRLYNKAQEGYEIVLAQRKIRQDGFIKKISSKAFYSVFSYLTDTKQDHTIGNFGIYHRKVIVAILGMKDHIRYFPTMSQWVGFNKAYMEVKHSKRETGKSSYSFNKLFNLAFNNIIAFSDKPLRLTIKFGLVISLVSFFFGLYFLYKYFSGRIEIMGFTSLIISIWFLSGILILILGIVGMYIGKTFEKVKGRPTYIVKEKINFE
jgi:dolichol-phosphate mannosyltransferase